MRILIIGGTRFVGRHLVTAALARNHDLTLFNRGNHPNTFPHVETIQGNRNVDLAKLSGGRWEAVIDTSGYLPRSVKASAEFLSQSVDRYVFISSISAYADFSVAGIDETAHLKTLTNEQIDEANAIDSSGPNAGSYGALYGGLKALSEREIEEVFPDAALVIRPGLIVGPDDYTDRFTYWVVRVARGGEVLAPAPREKFVQFIDARDLAEWTVKMIEERKSGIYNANGLPERLTMESLLETCKEVSDSNASFTWASEEFLLRENVTAWTKLPLWLPEEAAPHMKGFMFISSDKAVKNGLSFRPLATTIEDTLHWFNSSREDGDLEAGLKRDHEERLLMKWRTQQANLATVSESDREVREK